VPSSVEAIRALFAESARVAQVFLAEETERLAHAVDVIAERLAAGGKLLLFGNGGSAADAQHIATEFVGRLRRDRPAIAAIALTTDTSALTAIANDYGYEEIFARQIEALGRHGDVALAISTSGRSPNVLRAVGMCRERGIAVVGLTGGGGGDLVNVADVALRVSASTNSSRIQETHILVGHVICELVERRLVDSGARR
jgi:D-sedoheptulose 7-phosphate isomerase